MGNLQGRKIFISAAEPSGDIHGANLIREFRDQNAGDISFFGVAGPRMQAEGCVAMTDLTARASMLAGMAGNVFRAAGILSQTTHEFSHSHYDAAVVIDSPVLNLPIALRAKSRAIPVLYYIAPQLWAWGASRVHKVRARVDKMAVVLPFEEEYFRSVGLDATYVGHPLFDHLAKSSPDHERVQAIKSAGDPVIAILPGSRPHVVREVLPGQLEVACAILGRYSRGYIAVSAASAGVAGIVRQIIARYGKRCMTVHESHLGDLLAAADLSLVASGTATLEVAYHGCPMIVMYNGSRLMYELVGRWLITAKHLSLVNILADRELVPEFMPYYRDTRAIARTALDMLSTPARLSRMRVDLAELIAPMSDVGASARTARLLADMIDSH